MKKKAVTAAQETRGEEIFHTANCRIACDWRVLERYIDIHKDTLDEDEEEEQLEPLEIAR